MWETFTSPTSTRILSLLTLLQLLATSASAAPSLVQSYRLVERGAILNNDTGNPLVFKDTGAQVPQGPGTDGAGSGFDVPALLWLGFCFLIGIPMAFAGIRGWRFTTGTAIGLSAAVSSYAAIVNTVDEVGVSDLVLTFIVFAFFFLGFILGLFEFARLGGITLIGITGGLAIGIRASLAKEGMLFSASDLYVVNWVVPAVLGAVGGLSMIWKQRVGLTMGCASIGTFLSAVGIDLIMSKQSGLSQGLRFLFDRNDSHLVDIIGKGYHPTLMTRIIIYASLALTPILAYAQHRIFRHTFSRKVEPDDSELQIDFPPDPPLQRASPGKHFSRPATAFLTNLWEGAKSKSANRFSLDSIQVLAKARRFR